MLLHVVITCVYVMLHMLCCVVDDNKLFLFRFGSDHTISTTCFVALLFECFVEMFNHVEKAVSHNNCLYFTLATLAYPED